MLESSDYFCYLVSWTMAITVSSVHRVVRITSFKMPAALSEREVSMLLSAICFFISEGDRLGEKRYPVNQKVSECLGVPLPTVKKYRAGMKENEDCSPTPKKKRCVQTGRPPINLDDFSLNIVKRTIYDFYMIKVFPSITNILSKLKENVPDFPQMSESTLLRTIKKLGFRFKKFNRKPVLMESVKIAASRHTFLYSLNSLRSQGYKIFYTDETWCNQNHTLSRGWQECVLDALNRDFNNYDQYRAHIQEIYGWRGGFKTPSGKGQRIIIVHIGSEDGFLDGAELCFVGKKNTGDYHNEMNSDHYLEWFERVLNLLPQKSAVIIDQAPYHTMVDPDTKNPNMSWKKCDIIQWIVKNEILPPNGIDDFVKMTKAQLIVHAEPYFKIPQKKIEQLTEKVRPDVKLVWLPVAHCELNPIELIWAYVKGKVAKVNMANAAENGRRMDIFCNLCQEALRSVTPQLWKKCIEHSANIEKQYRERDGIVETIFEVQPIIINPNSTSDSSDLSDEFSEEDY